MSLNVCMIRLAKHILKISLFGKQGGLFLEINLYPGYTRFLILYKSFEGKINFQMGI